MTPNLHTHYRGDLLDDLTRTVQDVEARNDFADKSGRQAGEPERSKDPVAQRIHTDASQGSSGSPENLRTMKRYPDDVPLADAEKKMAQFTSEFPQGIELRRCVFVRQGTFSQKFYEVTHWGVLVGGDYVGFVQRHSHKSFKFCRKGHWMGASDVFVGVEVPAPNLCRDCKLVPALANANLCSGCNAARNQRIVNSVCPSSYAPGVNG
jgi:hypothetical protein